MDMEASSSFLWPFVFLVFCFGCIGFLIGYFIELSGMPRSFTFVLGLYLGKRIGW